MHSRPFYPVLVQRRFPLSLLETLLFFDTSVKKRGDSGPPNGFPVVH